MTIYFRADANSTIGLGHLTRLIALAEMLKGDFECVFLIQKPSEENIILLDSKGLKLIPLNSTVDYLSESIEISDMISSRSIVVLDGYFFNQEYIDNISKHTHKIVLIDDFTKSFDGVDVIINHALGVKSTDYHHQNIIYCLGADYALLRPSFLEIAKKKKEITEVSKAFICFGGTDTYNLTLKTLQELENNSTFKEINVILASTFPFTDTICRYKKKSKLNIIIHENLSESNMAKLMFECHFAIAPTSGLSYEICAAKMIFIGGYYVDNQKAINDGFVKKGCLYSLGDLSSLTDSSFSINIVNLLNKPEKGAALIKQQQDTITGQSDVNFIRLFKDL